VRNYGNSFYAPGLAELIAEFQKNNKNAFRTPFFGTQCISHPVGRGADPQMLNQTALSACRMLAVVLQYSGRQLKFQAKTRGEYIDRAAIFIESRIGG
jgi:hypothetical protein